MQQSKISILSTKSLDDGLIRELNARDVLIDVLPFIKTESISSTELQKKIQQVMAMSATIIFTSTNAVEAVVAELKGKNPHGKSFVSVTQLTNLSQKILEKHQLKELQTMQKNWQKPSSMHMSMK